MNEAIDVRVDYSEYKTHDHCQQLLWRIAKKTYSVASGSVAMTAESCTGYKYVCITIQWLRLHMARDHVTPPLLHMAGHGCTVIKRTSPKWNALSKTTNCTCRETAKSGGARQKLVRPPDMWPHFYIRSGASVTIKQAGTKFNRNLTLPNSKQHATVSIQPNVVMSYISKEIRTRQCRCTVFTTFRRHCRTAAATTQLHGSTCT